MKKIRKNSKCWEWPGYINPQGYGMISAHGTTFAAHRIVWESVNGKIPTELELDHLCRNRKCVNPAHLELVTSKENVLRGIGLTAQNAKKKVCPTCGNPYSRTRKGDGKTRWRVCNHCHVEYKREWRKRRKAALLPNE